MKLIIAGTRTFELEPEVVKGLIIAFGLNPKEVVCGGSRGVDNSGKEWAELHGIPVNIMMPNWNDYGKMAGPLRNSAMARYADELLLIWDGKSRGSASMREEMLKAGKPVHEVIFRQEFP